MVEKIDSGRPQYGMIIILMFGAFICVLNNTLLNIALPSIMVDLKIDPATVQWVTTGYMLVNGILTPASAFIIQKYSIKRLFLSAMILFSLGTIIAGSAYHFPILLLGRMTQAAGTSIMMPLLLNVMLVSFPVEKRGTAMGIYSLVFTAAPAIGPTLSGWIIEHYDWRMLFHFVAPLTVMVVIIGFFLLKSHPEKKPITLDKMSLVLSSIGFGNLLYGFSAAGKNGWNSPVIIITIVTGIISVVLFVLKQTRQESPMLNFRIFTYPMYALSSGILTVTQIIMYSTMMILPIYVQSVLGISPIDAGIMMLPGVIVTSIMAPIVGKVFDRFGGRVMAIVGLSIIILTTWYFSVLSLETSYAMVTIMHTIRMFGMSMVAMPVQTNGLNQLPKELYPHGTAMNSTINYMAGSVGTAFLFTIMTKKSNEVIQSGSDTLSGMLSGINHSFFMTLYLLIFALVLALFIRRGFLPQTKINVNNAGTERR
jgi:EmrB/QacA subfamily drug resistance transporter